MLELKFALQPKQKQLLQQMELTPILFYGGAKGGGKSRGMRDVFLIRRFKYPGTSCGIFRKTYPELEANHIEPLFRDHPALKQYYNEGKKTLTLPNGSSMKFRYAESENDLDRYQGDEYDDLGIEEAGQWQEATFRKLHGSNRTSKPGVKARCLLTGNPGGIGHGWLKRLFIERRFNANERPTDYGFIQAKVYDNDAIMLNDPDYVHRLEANPNIALRKAYLDGDWNIFAGQFFQEISRDVHLIKAFDIPPHWNRFGAYDYGFNHPAAFGWFANDEDGNTYQYRELVRAGMRIDQFAAELNKHEDTKQLYPIVAGLDCWAVVRNKINAYQGENPPTIAEEFASHGINLKPAIVDRIPGAARLRSYLAWQGKLQKKSRLAFFDTCPITFDTVSRMIHDPDKVEDVLKVDATEGDPLSGDDAYDMVRYGMMSRPAITDPVVVKHPVGSKGWYEKQADISWEAEREKLVEGQGEWPEPSPNPWGIL